jgi:hypothetical protein
MNFWLPTAFAFLALIPLIILLHMLRPRRIRVVVPSLLPWTAQAAEARNRPGFGWLRQWLSLILSILIFLLLLLALAQPDFAGWFRPRSTVIIMDLRARMQATDGNGSRAFDRARDLARSYASRARSTHSVALMTVPPTAALVPFTTEARPLMEALDRLEPTDASGNLSQALALAESVLGSRRGNGETILITDRIPPDALPENAVVYAVGAAAGNSAITAMDARRSATGTTQVFLLARNFSDVPTPVEIGLRLDGRLVDAASATLESGGERNFSFVLTDSDLRQANRGELTARIEKPVDALPSDNSAHAVVAAGPVPKVLLVTRGNPSLEKALAADTTLKLELLGPESWQAGFLNAFPAVIFDDWLPADLQPGTDFPGNALYLGKSPWDVPGATIENPVVTDQTTENPILQNVQLAGVRIRQAVQLELPKESGWRTLAESADDPLVVSWQNPGDPTKRAILLTFRPENSDLPGRVAFPLLISNAVHWLIDDALPQPQTAGESEFLQAGFHATPTGQIAVNPAAEAESDVRSATSGIHGDAVLQTPHTLFANLWQVLVILALALILTDWAAYHRRWIPNSGR